MLTNSECGIINEKGTSSDEIEGQDVDKNNIWDDIKRTFTDFSYDCKSLLIDIGLPIGEEYIGMIIDVQPICPVDEIPLRYRDGKCYHQIKMINGQIYKLIFANINFDSISQHLQTKRIVRITYKEPHNRIINIFPQRLYRILTYANFIEEYEHTINKKSFVRICSLDNQIIKVEFINQNKNEDTNEVISLSAESNLNQYKSDDETVEKESKTSCCENNEGNVSCGVVSGSVVGGSVVGDSVGHVKDGEIYLDEDDSSSTNLDFDEDKSDKSIDYHLDLVAN